ncbi:hypothetical protein RI129_000170 [Pyrocoelia pectoralis]|uniref:RBR-type E3 ubiquitin transferase n=1 Tax=Pyrocoelia pectoralis TaxID=417401 RepID=A0AAN7ZFI7_9COLE
MNSDDFEDSGNETSGDDVDFAIEAEASSTREIPTIDDDYPFEVFSTDDIVQYMIDRKLMERFYDGNQDQLFQEAHVINPFKRVIVAKPKFSRKILGTEECEICFMILPPSQMTGLECGHRFCYQCWNEYLSTKIIQEGVGQTIACAAHNCPILVDDQTAMRLLKDPRIRIKYQHLITNSFVECNRLLRWCPSPDCSYAIKVSYVDARPVACRCGHIFCFSCGENWHDPVRCGLLRKWIKKCDDDSETSNWIAANTKECPKCNATIEKDGGCNHMVCKNQNCKADFVGSAWDRGSRTAVRGINCNRYDEDEAKAARDAQERSRAALQRYLFYCNRYMNHMQSLKFEHKLYAAVKDKMEEMQQHNMSWIECRQTLMYTYVFAYYLRKNNQSRATELLSEYLERDITQENLVDIKQKVQDKYRYCDGRRKALLAHVHEGYEKDWWEYTD